MDGGIDEETPSGRESRSTLLVAGTSIFDQPDIGRAYLSLRDDGEVSSTEPELKERDDAHPTRARARPAVHQHDPDAVDRCYPGGELGPPGHAHGDGAGRIRALAAVPALRSRGPDLAQPRPLRAVGRTRLDAALLAAAPRPREGRGPGLRDARRAVREARRHRALPPARLQGGRPPGVPLDIRRRDHDRTARPGRRDLGRDGDRRAVARGALQPPRLRAVRLRRVRARRRRRSDGGSLIRGGFDRRAPEALEPVLDL